MALFYKGVGVGTFLHQQNVAAFGISPHQPGAGPNLSSVLQHIARGTTYSPFVSLTRSYMVAEEYAIDGSRVHPNQVNPAHVYQINLSNPLPSGVTVVDPVSFISSQLNPLASPSYQHDGPRSFLLGVVDPAGMAHHLNRGIGFPPGLGGVSRPPNLTIELEAMVNALRDSEILIIGTIPQSCIACRFDVW